MAHPYAKHSEHHRSRAKGKAMYKAEGGSADDKAAAAREELDALFRAKRMSNEPRPQPVGPDNGIEPYLVKKRGGRAMRSC